MKDKCRAGDKLPTEEQYERIVEVAEDRHKYLFRIAQLTGFRISEILGLSTQQGEGRNYIDLENSKIILAKQKNGRVNEPFMTFPTLEITIMKYLEEFGDKVWAADGWLFWSKRKGFYRNMPRSTALSMVQKYRRDAGLLEIYGKTKDGKNKYRFSMHSSRHYAINDWGRRCVERTGHYDTNTISCMSRHKNPSSLESYRVLDEKIRRKVTDTLMN